MAFLERKRLDERDARTTFVIGDDRDILEVKRGGNAINFKYTHFKHVEIYFRNIHWNGHTYKNIYTRISNIKTNSNCPL